MVTVRAVLPPCSTQSGAGNVTTASGAQPLPPSVLEALQAQAAECAIRSGHAIASGRVRGQLGGGAGGVLNGSEVAAMLRAGVTRGLMAACEQHGVPVQQVGGL
jgi:hypothetical protein